MKKVFEYFEEILAIPRMSGKEHKIVEYLINFAKENKLEYNSDKFNNIIIKKRSTIPNCSKTIILQGHIDMVCEKDQGIDFNFDDDKINWYIDGDYYCAKGTTLGADNGIGIAIILAILSDNNIQHSNIEALFTSEEETTMNGAKNLDYSLLNSKTLLSIDGIKEAVIEVSSAGMSNTSMIKSFNREKINNSKVYKVTVDGLLGGHSGDDIGKDRANAIKVLGEFLNRLDDFSIISINGGMQNNIIPSFIECTFCINKFDIDEIVSETNKYFKKRYGKSDSNINIKIEELHEEFNSSINKQDSEDILKFINEVPDGLLRKDNENFPITSSNLGIIKTDEDNIHMEITIRSSEKKDELEYLSKLEKISKLYNFKYSLDVRKPFFPYKEDSKLRKLLLKSYKKLYDKDCTITKVHACMEGGLFSDNILDLDICVISPNVYDIHTTRERLSISSTERTYNWIIETLKQLSNCKK